ncbi:sterol desaturase family protein [Undibacterium sp. RTI2.1]|uniref:sterol desaturase family protein n=1 Tax=unclassified Undibacterium TaxID=2630295 RepID=UPI002AB428AA|nr:MULTISPECIES: sterol desaturase family protein [unclassified Undibacterium]MDY7537394.1 sterol desaturase family protein [Undibacterium sp. 5I1]MEB0031220.1 sterol desaturase family protein [Undibacterium sp. RTI2.1]MEB0117600.1 sterol desaturase family protein [Undibacterium sp. RTI2.2]MEB0232264.1 sterol desaturase family protein [Undibacterium sp. 10I3]MEB0259719.1 sterol desaturase family protein [Undibacterium sp. 5I1]
MQIFSLEQSKLAYRVDFIFYSITSILMATFLITLSPSEQFLKTITFVLTGLLSWTLIEYVLHRFVLHGVRPFSTWHQEHHQRPTALICTPTILSAMLIFGLVFLPTLVIADLWRASSLTLGLLTGYLLYTITHHATHHWRANYAWLLRRKRWHAVHHHPSKKISHFGVTNAFWDKIFGSDSN